MALPILGPEVVENESDLVKALPIGSIVMSDNVVAMRSLLGWLCIIDDHTNYKVNLTHAALQVAQWSVIRAGYEGATPVVWHEGII